MKLPNPEDLEDIKNLHELAFPWQDYTVAFFILVVLAILVLLFYRFWKSRNRQVLVEDTVRPAVLHWGVEVDASLRKLEARTPAELEDLRKSYFELSALLRLILEKCLTTNMTDLTSREIMERLNEFLANPSPRSSKVLDADTTLRVKDYFARVDLLLFAKQDIGTVLYADDCLWLRTLFAKALELEKIEFSSQGMKKDLQVAP